MAQQKQQKEQNKSKKGGRIKQIIILIIILLLLGGNGYLIYRNMQTQKEKASISKELDKVEKKRNKLKKKLNQKISELEKMTGKNEHLDSLITEYKNELKKQRAELKRIRPLANRAARYRQQMQKFKKAKEKYESEVDSLNKRVAKLQKEKSALTDTLTTTKTKVDTLQKKKKKLEKKVDKASILQAKNVEPVGLKESGDEFKETDNAGKVEKFRVCFDLAKNFVLEPGKRKVLIQMVGPKGGIMELEGKSGKFTEAASEKEKQYTLPYEFDHHKPDQKKHLCIEWAHEEEELPEGKYTINLYHKGRNIGTQKFELGGGFLGIF